MTLHVRLGWLFGLAAMAAAMLGAAPARALTGRPLNVCLMRAVPGMEAPALFQTPLRFDCAKSHSKHAQGDYWVLSQRLPKDAVQTSALSVQVASVWQDRVTLYVLYADGTIRHTGFTSRTAGRHLRMGAKLALTLPSHKAPPCALALAC